MAKRFRNFREFWPYYLAEHSRAGTRLLHFVGTSIMWILFAYGIWTVSVTTVLCGIIAAYALAWVGHFVIERNIPATFRYPLYSLIADLKMWGLMLTGRIETELSARMIHQQRH